MTRCHRSGRAAPSDSCLLLRWLLLFIIENVVHNVPGEHVLVDVPLHDKEHVTQPAGQPPPLSA